MTRDAGYTDLAAAAAVLAVRVEEYVAGFDVEEIDTWSASGEIDGERRSMDVTAL